MLCWVEVLQPRVLNIARLSLVDQRGRESAAISADASYSSNPLTITTLQYALNLPVLIKLLREHPLHLRQHADHKALLIYIIYMLLLYLILFNFST